MWPLSILLAWVAGALLVDILFDCTGDRAWAPWLWPLWVPWVALLFVIFAPVVLFRRILQGNRP